MLSVLIAHNYYRSSSPSGEDQVFEAEADLLAAKGHVVHKYVRRSDEIAQFPLSKRAALLANIIWSHQSYLEVKNLLTNLRPDIAHFHNTFPLISASAFRACRELGVPIVQTLHNYRPLCMNGLLFRDGGVCHSCVGRSVPWAGVLHRCYRGSLAYSSAMALRQFAQKAGSYARDVDLFIAPSEFARGIYIAARYDADRIKVKPHFTKLDTEVYDGERRYALFVGRISSEKGVDTLLAAWQRLPEIPLIIVGDGAQAQQLRTAAKQLPNVRFVGQISHAEVLSHVKRASYVVIPSQCPETFGLVAIEAMACGTPLIASKLGALPEIAIHGHNGLLFDPGDSDDLARKAEELWTHPEYATTLGTNARCDYEARFTAEKNYELLIQEYTKVVESYS